MTRTRLEAFSDAVIAIIMTVMVLELKVPHGVDWSALGPLVPVILSYVLSFLILGIYWNNHHHMLHTTDSINGRILWANLHLLFWLSLVPFTTAWMGENHAAPIPTIAYGVVLTCAAVAYWLLKTELIAHQGEGSTLKDAVGKDRKGVVSIVLNLAALPLAFVSTKLAIALYTLVVVMWLIPDRRIEKKLKH